MSSPAPKKKNKNVNNGKFIKLVEKHFKNDLVFDVEHHINNIHNKDDYIQIDNLPICKILPGTKLIADDDIYNIVYHGRECSIKITRLYEYKKYFIVHDIEVEGDDCSVTNIENTYEDGPFGAYKDFKVHRKKTFDIEKFLDDSDNINFIMDIYKKVYLDNGLNYFQEYIKNRYEK